MKYERNAQLPLPRPAATEIAFLAGFFDGEGSVTALEKQLRIEVQGTHEGSLRRLEAAFGGNTTLAVADYSKRAYGKTHWQPLWRWTASSGPLTKAILLEMLPYLMVKKREALEALHWPTYDGTNRYATMPADIRIGRAIVAARVKALKHGGWQHNG